MNNPRNICSKAIFHALSKKLVSNDLDAYDEYAPDKSMSAVNKIKYCWSIVEEKIDMANNITTAFTVIFLFKKNIQKGMHIAYNKAAL